MAIQLVEAKFSSIKTWQLSTILQETRLLSFYQTLGYQLSDRTSPIVTGMDRVFLTKTYPLKLITYCLFSPLPMTESLKSDCHR